MHTNVTQKNNYNSFRCIRAEDIELGSSPSASAYFERRNVFIVDTKAYNRYYLYQSALINSPYAWNTYNHWINELIENYGWSKENYPEHCQFILKNKHYIEYGLILWPGFFNVQDIHSLLMYSKPFEAFNLLAYGINAVMNWEIEYARSIFEYNIPKEEGSVCDLVNGFLGMSLYTRRIFFEKMNCPYTSRDQKNEIAIDMIRRVTDKMSQHSIEVKQEVGVPEDITNINIEEKKEIIDRVERIPEIIFEKKDAGKICRQKNSFDFLDISDHQLEKYYDEVIRFNIVDKWHRKKIGDTIEKINEDVTKDALLGHKIHSLSYFIVSLITFNIEKISRSELSFIVNLAHCLMYYASQHFSEKACGMLYLEITKHRDYIEQIHRFSLVDYSKNIMIIKDLLDKYFIIEIDQNKSAIIFKKEEPGVKVKKIISFCSDQNIDSYVSLHDPIERKKEQKQFYTNVPNDIIYFIKELIKKDTVISFLKQESGYECKDNAAWVDYMRKFGYIVSKLITDTPDTDETKTNKEELMKDCLVVYERFIYTCSNDLYKNLKDRSVLPINEYLINLYKFKGLKYICDILEKYYIQDNLITKIVIYFDLFLIVGKQYIDASGGNFDDAIIYSENEAFIEEICTVYDKLTEALKIYKNAQKDSAHVVIDNDILSFHFNRCAFYITKVIYSLSKQEPTDLLGKDTEESQMESFLLDSYLESLYYTKFPVMLNCMSNFFRIGISASRKELIEALTYCVNESFDNYFASYLRNLLDTKYPVAADKKRLEQADYKNLTTELLKDHGLDVCDSMALDEFRKSLFNGFLRVSLMAVGNDSLSFPYLTSVIAGMLYIKTYAFFQNICPDYNDTLLDFWKQQSYSLINKHAILENNDSFIFMTPFFIAKDKDIDLIKRLFEAFDPEHIKKRDEAYQNENQNAACLIHFWLSSILDEPDIDKSLGMYAPSLLNFVFLRSSKTQQEYLDELFTQVGMYCFIKNEHHTLITMAMIMISFKIKEESPFLEGDNLNLIFDFLDKNIPLEDFFDRFKYYSIALLSYWHFWKKKLPDVFVQKWVDCTLSFIKNIQKENKVLSQRDYIELYMFVDKMFGHTVQFDINAIIDIIEALPVTFEDQVDSKILIPIAHAPFLELYMKKPAAFKGVKYWYCLSLSQDLDLPMREKIIKKIHALYLKNQGSIQLVDEIYTYMLVHNSILMQLKGLKEEALLLGTAAYQLSISKQCELGWLGLSFIKTMNPQITNKEHCSHNKHIKRRKVKKR